MDLIISQSELIKLIAGSTEIGFQRGLETAGTAPKFISQNAAYTRFQKARVRTWVENELIHPKHNGNGRNSTIYYEYARLLELEMSDNIIVRKAYESPVKR